MKKVYLINSGLFAIVDDEDYEKVAAYKWYALRKPGRIYARANTSRAGGQPPRSVMMHWLVADKWVDHIDRDGLNNTRANLRPCTASQNAMNKRKQVGCVSRFKGVSYEPKKRLWRARITIDGKMISLGRFKSEEAAARAYDAAAKELFFQFARPNLTGGLP